MQTFSIDAITLASKSSGAMATRALTTTSAFLVVQSDGNKKKLDPNGYAVTTHAYKSPGDYLVRVQRTDARGVSAVGHLHLHVDEGR